MNIVAALILVAGYMPQSTMEIPFRNLGFGSNGIIKDGGAIVMRDAKAFDLYRVKMGTSKSRRPKIDWKVEQVVALHATGTGTGGSSLQVAKVRRSTGGGLQVEVYMDRASSPSTPTPGVIRPLRREGMFAMIAVKRTEGPVTLKVVDPPRDRDDTPGMSV